MENDKIWLSSPHMGNEELNFVQEAFKLNWIAPIGPHVDEFEKALSTYNDIDYTVALSSGTAAIHLALIILGIEQGDEVICSSFTFSGSCNPIVYQKATPIFVDSEKTTWNMDAELLEEAILDRKKKTGKAPGAIIAVHLYGMPCNMNNIMSVAKRHGIPVIEDAAEALGSTYKGQKMGTFGDVGIYSFNGNKIITTSGGGAFVSRNPDFVAKAKFLSTQARDAAAHYEHSSIGYNYRLSNVCAAIGLGQMKVLDDRIKRRREIFEQYQNRLNSEYFLWLKEPEGVISNRWLTTAIISENAPFDREELRISLLKENIETRPLWKPMHLQPVFKQAPAYINGVSENLFNSGICLPSGTNLTDQHFQRIFSAIDQFK